MTRHSRGRDVDTDDGVVHVASKPMEERSASEAGLESRGQFRPLLSFVIPAYNEEKLIPETIEAIQRLVPPLPYEIIVIDNGSTDDTAQVASKLNATVIMQPGGTIGALRNTGVRACAGDVVVFLDADVVLTKQWAERIPTSLEVLRREPRIVTGAMCGVPSNSTWLERYWFAPRHKASHIGSGHMILTRQFFHELNGFDESIPTGEDYDLSRRAVMAGGRIVPDNALHVEHHGFPRTVRAFVQRESWHGIGDYRSFRAFTKSKVALLSTAFITLHVTALVSLAAGMMQIALAAIAVILLLCSGSSYRQYHRESIRVILFNSAFFWIYYAGRALALIRTVTGKHERGGR